MADAMTLPPSNPTPQRAHSRAALVAFVVASAKSVAGGVALTLLIIGLVVAISAFWFTIPQPSALYLLAVTAATLLGGMRSGLISALIVLAFSAYATHVPGARPFPTYDPAQTTRLTLFGITAPAMAILIGVLRRRNDDLLRDALRREMAAERAAEQAATVARQVQADLDREHRIAVTLQSALLSPLPTERAFAGVGIGCCYQAASSEAEVGGDFYDVVALDERTIAVVVGDVSGKGLAAAAKTAEVKYTLRTVLHDLLVRQSPDSQEQNSAGEALTRVNQVLARTPYAPWGSEGTFAATAVAAPSLSPVAMPTFVCLTVAVLNTATGEGTLAVAAMEPPVVLRRRLSVEGDANEIVGEILSVGGLPVGVTPDAAYAATNFRLAPGETLALSTDGVTESRRRGSAVLFGVDGLCQAAEVVFDESASNDAADSLNDRAARIVAAAKAFAGAETLKDDACVLLVRRE